MISRDQIRKELREEISKEIDAEQMEFYERAHTTEPLLGSNPILRELVQSTFAVCATIVRKGLKEETTHDGLRTTRMQLEHSVWDMACHDMGTCVEEYCTLHNRSNHSMRDFPQHWRGDRGIMERICTHGIGHPDPDEYKIIKGMDNGTHGCDGCCHPSVVVPDLKILNETRELLRVELNDYARDIGSRRLTTYTQDEFIEGILTIALDYWRKLDGEE